MGYEGLVKKIAGRRAVFDQCIYCQNQMIQKLTALGVECVKVETGMSDEEIERVYLGKNTVLLTRDYEFANKLGRNRALLLPCGRAGAVTNGQKYRAALEVEKSAMTRNPGGGSYTILEFKILRGLNMMFGKHDEYMWYAKNNLLNEWMFGTGSITNSSR